MEGSMKRCWMALLIVTAVIIRLYYFTIPGLEMNLSPVITTSTMTSTPTPVISNENMAASTVIPHDVRKLATRIQHPLVALDKGIAMERDAIQSLVIFAHFDVPALTERTLISLIDEMISKICHLRITKASIHLMISSVVNYNDTDFDVSKAIGKFCPSFGAKVTLRSSKVSGDRLFDPRELWHEEAFHWYLRDAKYFIIFSGNTSANCDINAFWTTCVNYGASATSAGSICVNMSHFEALGFVVPIRMHPLQVFPKSVVPNASLVYPPYQAWIPWLVCLHGEKTAVDFTANMNCNDPHRLSRDRYLLHSWLNRTPVSATARKEVSEMLYGNRLKYIYGIFRNAILVHIFYPDWRLRVTLNRTIEDPVFTKKLESLGVHLVHTNESKMPKIMWRMLVADDPNVDVFIMRDADSRFTRREAILVDDWLKTDATVHILRDHPAHKVPMMAGMWGARRVPFMTALKRPMRELIKNGNDQWFLATVIWPIVQNMTYLCLDPYYHTRFPGCHHLKMDRVDKEHVGQVYDEYEIPKSFV